MNIVSWNINALRAHEVLFRQALDRLRPDVLCLQEIRVREDQMTFPVKGYHSYMNPADVSQYYGTGLFIKNGIHPLSISFDLPLCGYEYEGRVMVVEFDKFMLVNSYWPFSAIDKNNKWLAYRLKWAGQFKGIINNLQQRKPIVICGDMNMVDKDIDAFDCKSVKRAGCFYEEEHEAFGALIKEEHLIDAYRFLHPNERKYTTWSYSKNDVNRINNEGFRIDYFLVSESLMKGVTFTDILDDIYGSDHCPIKLAFDI